MPTMNVTQARNELFSVMDSVLENERVVVTSKKGNMVLISEEYWDEITETLYILSDPDMLDAIKEARETPTSELKVFDWKNIL
ncbi:MAG: type II toxin-antitoxin system Phd/YefM family antitoxin [Candidatus Methanoplasma sp.]|jgi:prevent-host-death family protein|nr:type II toxin-antitoxin system Phd/YefM family antitoxin [Candidatus Methanoplasma sp.]